MPEETKIVYHIGDEQTPYMKTISGSPGSITLGDFKAAINKTNYKFFFRSIDQEYGVVKEEITNDECTLPLCENRIVAYLVAPDPDTLSLNSAASIPVDRKHNFPPQRDSNADSSQQHGASHKERMPTNRRLYHYDSQSTLTSTDGDTLSYDSRDDYSEYSTYSEITSSSRFQHRQKRHRYRKKRPKHGADTISTYSSSITDSSLSLNILNVTINLENGGFLGISIVGQSNENGDGGIYIGSIMKGGAVAADGRIEPGDMLLQVNNINFEDKSNEEAVRTLRTIVQKPGPITLTVAKCWDPYPDTSHFTIPRNEPVRPIDPAIWANNITAMQGLRGSTPYSATLDTSSDNLANSLPEAERYDRPLSVQSGMNEVVKSLKMPNSGLEVKTRSWLKITIPNAFIGSDLVNWLHQKVEGLAERREARKYASELLKNGYIRHTVNKITFSEQCYYIFSDYTSHGIAKDFSSLTLGDSNSDKEPDTLGPLPIHPWNPQFVAPNYRYSVDSTANPYHAPTNLTVSSKRQGPRGDGPPNVPVNYHTTPYDAISGHHSTVDAVSLSSANALVQRAHSQSSLTRRHLASFGAGDSGGGSGSDQASESHSSRSGAKSTGNTRRSRSGSERSFKTSQPQVLV